MSGGRTEGSTEAEIINRVAAVQEWLCIGHRRSVIIANCVQLWSVDDRTAKRYLQRAMEGFKEITQDRAEDLLGLHIEARNKLLRDLKGKETAGGASVALNILDSQAKLLGLVVKRVDHTSAGQPLDLSLLSDEDLLALQKLKKKLHAR